MTNGATSPSGDPHPGEIVYDDQVSGQRTTRAAADVPVTIAWVKVEDTWEPVLTIRISGTPQQRRITKIGRDDAFLETTIQSPPRQPAPQKPSPVPTPTPQTDGDTCD